MSIRLSATKLKTYATCPLQYKYLYELWLLQLPNEAFIIWTKYHKMLEEYHSGQEPVIEEWPHKELLTNMLKKYKENPVNWETVTTEERFKIEWLSVTWNDGSQEDVEITWVLDRKDVDKTVEYKTSSFDYKEDDYNTMQTKLYIWARDKLFWELLPLVYSVNNKKKSKSKKYKPQIKVIEPKDFPVDETEKEVLSMATRIKNKEFLSKPWSHCYYCPMWPKGTWNCLKIYDKSK